MSLFDPKNFPSNNFGMFIINRFNRGNWWNVLVLQQIQEAQYFMIPFPLFIVSTPRKLKAQNNSNTFNTLLCTISTSLWNPLSNQLLKET